MGAQHGALFCPFARVDATPSAAPLLRERGKQRPLDLYPIFSAAAASRRRRSALAATASSSVTAVSLVIVDGADWPTRSMSVLMTVPTIA